MNRKWQRGEITAFVMMGILALIGVATFLNTSINKTSKPIGTFAQTPSCPYNSNQNVPLGSTEQNQSNMENRWPISSNRHEYDFYSYFVPATIAEANASSMPVVSGYTTYADAPGGALDPKVTGMMGSMFGYKPNQLTDAYFMKYSNSNLQGADTLVKGSAPALKVPIAPGDPVKMPTTQYDIGGGKEALVVFAAADRITLHMSRAEYIRGSGGNNCNGNPCSGGYWIYIRGICVDQKIQDAYNSAKSAQESAGANKNAIQLPEILPGQILGLATGSSVEVIVRDNGPLISIHKPFYWSGVPTRDFGAAPTATPTTPVGVTPTNTPPPGAQCGYQGLRCCTPGDAGIPAGTTCFNSLSCVGNICQPPNPPGAQCGYAGLRCCTPADPVPAGTSCYSPNACVNNVCGTAPTATPTPTVFATWTPTPSPNGPTPIRPNCLPIVAKGNKYNKYDIVFIPNNYTDYNKFRTDVEETISKIEALNLGAAIIDKLNFTIFTDVTKSNNVVQCDPANGKKNPCWDRNIANTSMRICNGDAYIIIQDTPKPQENPDLARMALEYWGNAAGTVYGLGSGEVLILRYDVTAVQVALGRAITGVKDNITAQMWATVLSGFP